MQNTSQKLSVLWLFAMLNYLYCDVVGLMDAHLLRQYLAGDIDGTVVSPEFLFAASLLMEIPIAMVLFSILLNDGASRWANMLAGSLMTLVQIVTLFWGEVTGYYVWFSIIEISTTICIVLEAWQWRSK